MFVLRAGAVCTLAGLAACGGKSPASAPDGAPNVLLISIDTLRADRLGFYGYAKPTSPVLDAFARQAVVFEDVEASAPWTLPALASLMTGEVVSTHGCATLGAVLDDSFTTLPERLLAAGYDTACVVSQLFATSRHGLQQGFVHTDDSYAYPEVDPALNITSQVISDKGIRFLDQEKASPDPGPWLLWLHYFDPHEQYMPHPGLSEALVTPGERAPGVVLGDAYDGEVRYTDQHVGRVLERLHELGFDANTVVVLVADHGEEFFEHGGRGHGHSLHREVVHVPLAIRAPGIAARRVPGVARQIDVVPTLLELVGLAAPSDLPGQSLVPALRGAALAEVGALSELDNGDEHAVSLRRGRFRLIRSDRENATSLYDLASDPLETTDVAAQHPDELAALSAELVRAQEGGRERARRFGTARGLAPPPGTQDELEALGYGGEGARLDEPEGASGR